jgi:hypothetical protein
MENIFKLFLTDYLLTTIKKDLEDDPLYLPQPNTNNRINVILLDKVIHSISIKKGYINENRHNVVARGIDLLIFNFIKTIHDNIFTNRQYQINIPDKSRISPTEDNIIWKIEEDVDKYIITCKIWEIIINNK